MAQRNMQYDHPAYVAVLPVDMKMATGALLTGAAGATAKYNAFTNMLLKSINLSTTTLGSSADNILLYRITNNGTTAVNTVTATYTLGTHTSQTAYLSSFPLAAVGTGAITGGGGIGSGVGNNGNVVGGAGLGVPLMAGDTYYVAKGTDATAVYAVTAELSITPFANVTIG